MKLLVAFALAAALLAGQSPDETKLLKARLEASQAAVAAQQAALAVADAETKLMAAQYRYEQTLKQAQELMQEAVRKEEVMKELEAGGKASGKATVKRTRP